jgi:flavin reductase (DIM6/NTAB) family NADH-FMN oxidoreductase RutF
VKPKILYFGTPVVLISTENADGSFNLAPVSSAWALGHSIVLGLGEDGHTLSNLRSRPGLTINYPEPHLWEAVERLASLTGANPVPKTKPAQTTYRADKFAAAGLSQQSSVGVRPPRVKECGVQLEAKVSGISPSASGEFAIVECGVEKVHVRQSLVIPGTQHIDPGRWEPLIYNFRHYFGLGKEYGFSYRSETPGRSLQPDRNLQPDRSLQAELQPDEPASATCRYAPQSVL